MVVSAADAYNNWRRQKAEWDKTPEGKKRLAEDAKRAREWFDSAGLKWEDIFKPKEHP
jgi:hypothetical protein